MLVRVGIDFDNTIVSYDSLFHRVAVEQGLVSADTPRTKVAVRNRLRAIGWEDRWTELQGYVYGARMQEAEPYPGVLEFLRWACAERLPVSIISHKTKFPFAGPKYDLHEAARQWVKSRLRDRANHLIPTEAVFFELAIEKKLERIRTWGATAFVDDLPEILRANDFPSEIEGILFDPDNHHEDWPLLRARSWEDVRHLVEQRWRMSH